MTRIPFAITGDIRDLAAAFDEAAIVAKKIISNRVAKAPGQIIFDHVSRWVAPETSFEKMVRVKRSDVLDAEVIDTRLIWWFILETE